jgi:hypothetical protein
MLLQEAFRENEASERPFRAGGSVQVGWAFIFFIWL